jgi:transposase
MIAASEWPSVTSLPEEPTRGVHCSGGGSSGRPLTQVARELGIQPSMLRHWRDDRHAKSAVTRPAGSPPSGGTSAEHAEIRRLEKELARAQMERDILKKAIAIFSGPPK